MVALADTLGKYAEVIWEVLPSLLIGAADTIQITVLSVGLGLIIGVFVGLARMSRNKLIFGPATAYVDFMRGTPLLVQIFIVYFGIPELTGVDLSSMTAAVLACGINSGAYVAEIVRSGIQAVDRGQMEAARSLGMNYAQAMRYIIFPQAFKIIIPPMGNEFIMMLKDTSLVSAIAVEELTRKGQLAIAVTYQSFAIWTGVALCYLIMTMTIARLFDYVERRLGVSD